MLLDYQLYGTMTELTQDPFLFGAYFKDLMIWYQLFNNNSMAMLSEKLMCQSFVFFSSGDHDFREGVVREKPCG